MPDYATNLIKKIEVNGTTYDICDVYARRRLDGEGSLFSITYMTSYVAGKTYINILDGEDVTSKVNSSNVQNPSFNNYVSDLDLGSQNPQFVILLNQHPSANTYWVADITQMILGDTILVKEERTTAIGDEYCPDRWLSANGTSYVFSALNSKVDLSGYVEKGTYPTGAPNIDATGNASVTGTAASAGAQTATGTATITYQKANAATGSAGGVDLSEVATFSGTASSVTGTGTVTVAAHTINNSNATFTVSGTQSIVDHTHGVELDTATVEVPTSVTSGGEHTHDVAGHTHSSVTVLKTATFEQGTDTFDAGSLPTLTTTTKTVVTGLTGTTSFFSGATVVDSVLSFNSDTVTASTESVDGFVSNWGAGTLPTFTQGIDSFATTTVSVGNVGTAATWTAAALSAGAHTHGLDTQSVTYVSDVDILGGGAHTVTFSNANVSLSTPIVLTHSVTAGSITGTVTPLGSISGTIDGHTHGIGYTATSVTGTAAVAVSDHTHSVDCGSHTHSLSAHTHSVSLQ